MRFCQLKDIYAFRREHFCQLLVRHRAAEVVQVVTNFGRCTRLPAYCEKQFAFGRRLDDVVECVVLKNHRRHLAAKKHLREFAIFHAQTAEINCQFGLDTDIDLEIRRAIRRDDSLEIPE